MGCNREALSVTGARSLRYAILLCYSANLPSAVSEFRNEPNHTSPAILQDEEIALAKIFRQADQKLYKLNQSET